VGWEIGIVLSFLGVSVVYAVFAFFLDKQFEFLRVFSFWISLFFLLVLTRAIGIIAGEYNSVVSTVLDTAYNVLLWIVVFISFYLVVVFIRQVMSFFNSSSGDGEADGF